MELLSIVIPCYNEQETLDDFYKEIRKVRNSLASIGCCLEVIFIDDGSRDKTLDKMKQLAKENSWIKYLSFTKNFGKEAAIYAGLRHGSGNFVGLMDVDLQDPPSLIPKMLEILKSGEYDCVATRRVNRKGEPAMRSFFARAFYKLMKRVSDVEIVDGARDFRLMSRPYVDSVLSLKEYNRFSKGLFSWVGYKTKWLEYENVERARGETKWSFFKLLLYSIDGIVAFSTAPVRFASCLGLLFCGLAFVFLFVIFFRALIFGDPVAGWPSLVCVILLLSGTQLFCLGLLGEYLSKTYMEVKKRPIYLCRETNLDDTESIINERTSSVKKGEINENKKL
ncbi:MAG: glycosyltransferase family 2 protein [Hungatella sp.]|nr:glycosyltransferase family 2 protein [Hungatella sp.]